MNLSLAPLGTIMVGSINLFSVLIGSIVIGSIIITVIAHRILSRQGFRKYSGAYLLSAMLCGGLSFCFLLLLGVTFPRVAAEYLDALEGMLNRALPNTAMSELVIAGHFVAAICLGMTMGALLVWWVMNDSDRRKDD